MGMKRKRKLNIETLISHIEKVKSISKKKSGKRELIIQKLDK